MPANVSAMSGSRRLDAAQGSHNISIVSPAQRPWHGMDIEDKGYRHYAGTSLVVAKAMGAGSFISEPQFQANPRTLTQDCMLSRHGA